MAPITLRDNPSTEDDSWIFQAPLPHSRRPDMGLIISFSPDKITLDRSLFPQNRILQTDDASKFISASFQKLRFPDTSPRVAEAYMARFFKAGLFLNGKQYRFYGHSNSQLVCYDLVICHLLSPLDHSALVAAFFERRTRTRSSIEEYINWGTSLRSQVQQNVRTSSTS